MRYILTSLVLALFAAAPLAAQGAGVTTRVKDITTVKGTSDNTLTGTGLVVGLKGTGDKNDKTTAEMAAGLAESMRAAKGFKNEDYANGNIARVLVTCKVDEGTGVQGATVTATVSILDGSKSLEGGVLVQTNLVAIPGGPTIALASGLVSTPKKAGPAGGGANQGAPVVNVTAQITEDLKIPFFEEVTIVDDSGNPVIEKTITLVLHNPDVDTANEIARAINEDREILGQAGVANAGAFKSVKVAKAEGSGSVKVTIPSKWHGDEMVFRGRIGSVSVNPDVAASVIVNETTGVIVVSGNVRILPGIVAAAGVNITIAADGELPKKPVAEGEARDPLVPLGGPSRALQDLIDTLNALNLSAQEKIAVFRELRNLKLLQGKLIETR